MAEDIFYLLEVGSESRLRTQVAEILALAVSPVFVRMSVEKPVNTWGWPANAKGCLLGINAYGVTVGTLEGGNAPRVMIPWHDVNYIADGTLMAAEEGKKPTERRQAAISSPYLIAGTPPRT